MDNRSIDITSEGHEDLRAALSIAWRNAAGGKVKYWVETQVAVRTNYYVREADERRTANVSLPSQGLPPLHVHHGSDELEIEGGLPTLILLWYVDDSRRNSVQAFPQPLGFEQALDFTLGWLAELKPEAWPDSPWSDDVMHKPGWRAFTDYWGHVAGYHGGIVGIQPAWALYGK